MSDRNARIAVLFEQHAPRLVVYARRQAGAADAEDLVSEAFVVALRRLDELPSESGETFAWLVGTVRRLAANHRRRPRTSCVPAPLTTARQDVSTQRHANWSWEQPEGMTSPQVPGQRRASSARGVSGRRQD